MINIKCSHGFYKPKEKKIKIDSEARDIIIDLIPFPEAYKKVGTINMEEERRKEVYQIILLHEPKFNREEYANSLKMINNDRFEHNEGYFCKKGYEKKVYVKYPPKKDTLIKKGALGMDTIISLFNNYPLLREYMKVDNPDIESQCVYLKPCHFDCKARILLDLKGYLPWEYIQILLNVFLEYGSFNNVAVLSTYTSALCKQFRKDRKEELRLQSENSNDSNAASIQRIKTYNSIIKSISEMVRK